MSNKTSNNSQQAGINWTTAIFVFLFHLGAVAALFMFSWKALAITILLLWISGSLGIGIGYHRLLTHRGYRTPKAIEYLLTVCGMLALQGGPINWVVTHRLHHAHADGPGDPHTPREGRWWSHIGWILRGTAQRHDEDVLRRYAPDLFKDPIHVWFNRLYFVPLAISGLILLAIGDWSLVMWGVFLRTAFGLHATWLVNSATHLWGRRRFATDDDSTNNWWVALLTFGEGWHNNHHAHPRSARHGLAWYEIDMNWWAIQALRFLGLAKAIRQTTGSQLVSSLEGEELQRAA